MTTIEWTDESWNPVRGCTKVSPGCKHCYAEAFAERFRGVAGHPYEQGFDLRLVPEALEKPLHWRKPRRIFVNSMSDLFHEDVSKHFIWNVFGVMEATKRHTYQVLTKRAERMREVVSDYAEKIDYADDNPGKGGYAGRYSHVWLGVSVEDRKHGLPRLEHLRRTPAAVRFLSCEPLLEDLGEIELTGIGWVIIGGESGSGARPFDIAWARSILEQCRAANVPCFCKQFGAQPHDSRRSMIGGWAPGDPEPDTRLHLSSKKGNDPAEWPEDLRVREFPRPYKAAGGTAG